MIFFLNVKVNGLNNWNRKEVTMIGISKLYCDNIEASDVLRYHDNKSIPSKFLQFSSEKKPIVVWNVTKKCNLNCIHCYSESIV